MQHLRGGVATAGGQRRRGVPGEPECVLCWEEDCGGCALLDRTVWECPLCGGAVSRGGFHGWYRGRPCHWACLEDREEREEVPERDGKRG